MDHGDLDHPRVSALYIYPLKGARAIAIPRADVLETGLRHDRTFMALGENGSYLTQRERPRLALVETAIDGDELVLSVGGRRGRVPLAAEGPRRTVTVWKDDVVAIDVGGEGAELLSDHLGERCSLVRMPADTIRQVELEYAQPGDRVGFADAYPVLVANLASLDDLNAQLPSDVAPFGMDRFRPNIVVDGAGAWVEEAASHVRIGALSFRTPKKCARCVVVTTDQRTGEVGKEPLRTLASYRRRGNKASFAMNGIPDATGMIAVGDPVVFS